MSKDKNDTLLKLQSTNCDIQGRTVYLFGEIETQNCKETIQNLHFLAKTDGDITVYINSPGGNFFDGLAMYSAIKKLKQHIVGYAVGDCSSAASILLQACDKRIVSPECSILVHPGSTGFEGVVHDFISRGKAEEYWMDLMHTLYFDRAKKAQSDEVMPLSHFKKKFGKDVYLTPDEALKFGIIDEVETYK